MVQELNKILNGTYCAQGGNLSKIDRNEKVNLINLTEELQNSPLVIEEGFHNSYARFLTDKRFIYKEMNV